MDRSKIVALVTGAIAIILSLAYLLIVQLLDFRGEMLPAPLSQGETPSLAHLGASLPPFPTQPSSAQLASARLNSFQPGLTSV